MSRVRATTSHIYTSEDFLARGATCEVFKGICKNSGEVRALKILNIIFDSHVQEAFHRELDALRKLSHPNVVKFISVEQDLLSRKQVVVTEFCVGGSLQKVLNEPENFTGLRDGEFLLLLHHLSSGIKHLRHNGFIHRDIKPGNILRSFDEKGCSVYKLSDFGTAKPLRDEDQFMSLVGTEEYLHPAIYEVAFIDRSRQRQFDISVDLWSIGATLYHAATGKPPFVPYGGRNDRQTMYMMLTQKDTGFISGMQTSLNGEVKWSRNLPNSCVLSLSLAELITPMLAGLLESNPTKMWTFEMFFNTTSAILGKVPMVILFTNVPNFYTLYLEKSETYSDVSRMVAEKNHVKPVDQQFFYQGQKLLKIVNESTCVADFPESSMRKPIVLLETQNQELYTIKEQENEVLPEFIDPVNFEKDTNTALELCVKSVFTVDRIRMKSAISKGLSKTARNFRVSANAEFDILIASLLSAKEKFFDILSISGLDEVSFGDRPNSEYCVLKDKLPEDIQEYVEIIEETLKSCEKIANSIQAQLKHPTPLECFITDPEMCFFHNQCDVLMSKHLEECKTIFDNFKARRKQKTASYHTEQMHYFERKKMRILTEKIASQSTSHCLRNFQQVLHHFANWQRDFVVTNKQIKDLHQDLKKANKNIRLLIGHLPKARENSSATGKSSQKLWLKNLTETLKYVQLNQENAEIARKARENLQSLENIHLQPMHKFNSKFYVDLTEENCADLPNHEVSRAELNGQD